MKLGSPVPIIRIFTEEKAREYYIDFLGFTVDWEHRFGDDFPIYMQIHRDQIVLHLSEHVGDATPGSTVFVYAEGIDELHTELLSKKYKYLRPGIEDAEWGARVITLTDPFGNRLRIAEMKSRNDK